MKNLASPQLLGFNPLLIILTVEEMRPNKLNKYKKKTVERTVYLTLLGIQTDVSSTQMS